ncbi:MAG: hypothetical protein ACRC9N_02555 [Aeromonas sp.]
MAKANHLNGYNPHRVGVWVIHTGDAVYLAVGSHEQEALDACVDNGLFDPYLVHQELWEDCYEEELYVLGNASETFDLPYLSMARVEVSL